MNKTILISCLTTGVIGFGAGVAAAVFVLHERLAAEYEQRLQDEIDATKAYLASKTSEYPTPMDAVRALIPDAEVAPLLERQEAQARTDYRAWFEISESRAPSAPPGPLEEEVKLPYVISISDYEAGERKYDQLQLTYYAVDEILADEHDKTVDAEIVGTKNLQRFGDQSENQFFLYIRNEGTNTDYEIAKSDGSYRVLVLGLGESE